MEEWGKKVVDPLIMDFDMSVAVCRDSGGRLSISPRK